MLGEKDHKNKDIMKLVNPSIFDFFAGKSELPVPYPPFSYSPLLGLAKTLPPPCLQLHSQVLQMPERRLRLHNEGRLQVP